MKVEQTSLPGVLVLEPQKHGDRRGYFMETFHEKRYQEHGIHLNFVQDNISFSRRGILRGLHFQKPNPQGKLITVLIGEIYDVAVDIRLGSPTFGKWEGFRLSAENGQQLWVPPNFAHGFCVVSEEAMVSYKCTALYSPESEHSLLWNDPKLGIPWPIKDPELSAKDRAGLPLSGIPKQNLPTIEPQ